MTNHDRFVNVFGSRVGRTFSTAEIAKLMLAGSDIKPGSILPNDHADGNVGACWCAKNHSNRPIFERVGAGLYRVRPLGSQVGVQPPKAVRAMAAVPALGSSQRLVIDDAFIAEWHPKYAEGDEDEYLRLVDVVAREMASTGTISRGTFEDIWRWKKAYRKIGEVRMDKYDTLYAEAFRRAASEPPERKLGTLLAPGVKLPGVGGPTGSTLIHFMHPERMPIIDVRTVEVLFEAGLVSSKGRELAHYEGFRRVIDAIRRRCPTWSLRQIDRALFAYHKQILDKGNRCGISA
jgi:hypothetical protein